MDQTKFENYWGEASMSIRKIKLLVGGRTGVGKSSTINALIGDEAFKTDIIACTRENQSVMWTTDVGDIFVQDVPGFSEASAPNLDSITYKENLKEQAVDSHIFLFIFRADDRIQQSEIDFIREWNSDPVLSKVPTLIVFNKIDSIKPQREWNPESTNLEVPTTEKEKNIVRYLEEQINRYPEISQFNAKKRVIPISAGESSSDIPYGIENLRRAIKSLLPDALKVFMEREVKSIEEKARDIIKYYAAACAAAAVQPVPIVDSFIIAPIQLTMVIHLGRLHKRDVKKNVISGILNGVGLSFLGNYIFLTIIGFVPGVKQVVGPAIAFGLTYSAGLVVNELFSSGNMDPTEDQVKALVEKYKKEGMKAKEEFKTPD